MTDQPRPLMETSPQPPAMMGANPSAPRKSVRWNGYVLRTIDTIVSSDIYCYHLLFLLIFINDQFFKFQNLFYGPMKNNFDIIYFNCLKLSMTTQNLRIMMSRNTTALHFTRASDNREGWGSTNPEGTV